MAIYKCTGSLRKNSLGQPCCDYEAPEPWAGNCPQCNRPYNWRKYGMSPNQKQLTAAALSQMHIPKPFSTGIEEIDLVLSGGLHKDSCVLFTGTRGAGKTTLAYQIANNVASDGSIVVYAGGEMGILDMARYSQRFKTTSESLIVIPVEHGGSNIDHVMEKVLSQHKKPKLLVIDSAQSVLYNGVDGDAGSSGQINALANSLNDFVKEKHISTLLLCQMIGTGDYAGGTRVQHLADVLMVMRSLESDEKGNPTIDPSQVTDETRGLRLFQLAEKSRTGRTDITAVMRLTEPGFVSVKRKKKGKIQLVGEENED